MVDQGKTYRDYFLVKSEFTTEGWIYSDQDSADKRRLSGLKAPPAHYEYKTVHVIDIAALKDANERIVELETQIDLFKKRTEIQRLRNKNLVKDFNFASSQRQTLEQKLATAVKALESMGKDETLISVLNYQKLAKQTLEEIEGKK